MSNLSSIPQFDCLYKNKSGTYFYNVQLKSKRPNGGGFRRKLIKLKGSNLSEAIKDIRQRKLFQRFNNLSKKEKSSKMKALEEKAKELNYISKMRDKLVENLELFAWRGFRNVKCFPNKEIVSLKMRGRIIYFNPTWLSYSSDLHIIRKLRTFVER